MDVTESELCIPEVFADLVLTLHSSLNKVAIRGHPAALTNVNRCRDCQLMKISEENNVRIPVPERLL